MNRRDFNLYVGAAATLGATAPAAVLGADAPAWSIRADVAESCSCEIPCPCNFGRPTDLTCHGSRLVQITEGAIGGQSLTGVNFIVTFEMGQWTKIYLDERTDAAGEKAFEQALAGPFKGFRKLMRSMERVPLVVERGAEEMHFSVPASTVRIKLMRGLNGEPITIANLPSPFFHGYTQYESVEHRHGSDAAEWSYSGTNGFTSKMIASG